MELQKAVCSNCKEEKSLDNYYKRADCKNNHQYVCKICSDIYHEEYVKEKKDYIKKYLKNYYEKNIEKYKSKTLCKCGKYILNDHLEKHKETNFHMRKINKVKKCTNCKIEKSYDKFYKTIAFKDGLTYFCIECCKIIHKENKNRKSLIV